MLAFAIIILLVRHNIDVVYTSFLEASEDFQGIGGSRRNKRNTNSKGFSFFHLDRESLEDLACTIQYFHRSKTGGTFLETKMSALLGITRRSILRNGMNKFEEKPGLFCDAKFAGYQLPRETFNQVVRKKCETMYKSNAKNRREAGNSNKPAAPTTNQRKKTGRERMIIVTTYREPIARAVSKVHQMCNKKNDTRSKFITNLCTRCSYYDDADYYNNWFLNHESGLPDLYYGMLTNRTFWSSAMGDDSDGGAGGSSVVDGLLAIDIEDLDPFFENLLSTLPSGYEERLSDNSKDIKQNVENKMFCDFMAPSAMMKQMSETTSLYRKITMGDV
jgi:hypothetical protein